MKMFKKNSCCQNVDLGFFGSKFNWFKILNIIVIIILIERFKFMGIFYYSFSKVFYRTFLTLNIILLTQHNSSNFREI